MLDPMSRREAARKAMGTPPRTYDRSRLRYVTKGPKGLDPRVVYRIEDVDWKLIRDVTAAEDWSADVVLLTFKFMNGEKMRALICAAGARSVARAIYEAAGDFLEEQNQLGNVGRFFGDRPDPSLHYDMPDPEPE